MKSATKGARKALDTMQMPSSPAESYQRPKPSLHLELSDIDGEPSLSVGESVTLTVTGKVTSMSEEEHGDDKEIHTSLTLRLSKITPSGGHKAEPEEDADAE